MHAVDPLLAVRAARAVLVEHDSPETAAMVWALDSWLETGGDFAVALGFPAGWHCARKLRERDDALRQMAAAHFPTLHGWRLARISVERGTHFKLLPWYLIWALPA